MCRLSPSTLAGVAAVLVIVSMGIPVRAEQVQSEFAEGINRALRDFEAEASLLEPTEPAALEATEARARAAVADRATAESAYDDRELYRFDHVMKIVEEHRNQLLAISARPELEGMNAYIRASFPQHSLEVVSLPDGVFATASSVDELMTKVVAYTIRVAAVPLTIDLQVLSLPEEAAFVIKPLGGGRGRSTTTNSVLHNFYRGWYEYSLSKAGYKDVEDTVNLVDAEGECMHCKLHQRDDPEGPLPCRMARCDDEEQSEVDPG